jgi:hypothetical protein
MAVSSVTLSTLCALSLAAALALPACVEKQEAPQQQQAPQPQAQNAGDQKPAKPQPFPIKKGFQGGVSLGVQQQPAVNSAVVQNPAPGGSTSASH